MSAGDRITRAEAAAKAAPLLDLLRPAVIAGDIAGSFRREKPTIGDLEMVFIPSPIFHAHLDKLDAQGLITRGRAWGEKQRQFIYDGLKVDLYTANEDNFGYIFWLRTGSKDANHRVVAFCKNKLNPSPFRLAGGFVWYGTKLLHIPDEATLFRLFGIPFIEPKDREPETYARLFKSAKSHQWGDLAPFIKIENAAQNAMFEGAPSAESYDDERRGRYIPTTEEFAQGMRFLRRLRPLPQDKKRLLELLKSHQHGLETAYLPFMRDYHRKKLEEFGQLLKQLKEVG